MENQSSWLNLDTTLLYKPKPKSLNGVQVHLFLPPSLIPNAVRGSFCKQENRFVIEFRYMSPISGSQFQNIESDDKLICIQLDTVSGRVQKILIDVKTANAKNVQLNIASQISDSIRSTERKVETSTNQKDWIRESIEVARNAVNLKKEDLFASAFG